VGVLVKNLKSMKVNVFESSGSGLPGLSRIKLKSHSVVVVVIIFDLLYCD